MSAVRIALVFWGGFFLALGPLRSAGDGDLFWQHWLGDLVIRTHHIPAALGSETFTSAGAAWVPQEWLFSVLLALAMSHGVFVLFAVLISAVPAAILVFVFLRARTAVRPEAVAVVLVLCGLALVESFGIRAQVVGWGCLAAFLLCIERRDAWYYASIPIVVFWANFHASVFLAPAILLARIAGAIADDRRSTRTRNRDLRLLVFVAGAALCTPFGWHLPVYAIALVGSPIRHFILEWQPPGLTDPSFVFGACVLAALAFAASVRTFRDNKREIFPAAFVFVSMLLASRNVPLFAIVAAPLAARAIPDARGTLSRLGASLRSMEAAALTSIVVIVALASLLLTWGQRHEPPRLPIAAMAALSQMHRNRVFCENFAWCSVALQYPQLSVFIDGRCDPYPLAIWKSYVSAIGVSRSWGTTLQRYRVDAVVASRTSRLQPALAADQSWHLAFEDAQYVVYTRAT
jgi:hypothetical protein